MNYVNKTRLFLENKKRKLIIFPYYGNTIVPSSLVVKELPYGASSSQ